MTPGPADRPGGRRIADLPGTFTDEFAVPSVREYPTPPEILRVFRENGIDASALRTYTLGELDALVAREPAGENGELLWHMTISCPDRHPTWDEIKFARYKLLPADLCFGIFLPPQEFYVNLPSQDHVFHVWESTDPRRPWTGT